MGITVTYESRAYIHRGGTKYYRLAAVSIVNGSNVVNALLTNYGPYKTEKGDLGGHKPMHGGTSSIEYFDNPTSLANKLNSESIRRRTRGYEEIMEHRITGDKFGASEMEVQDILRGKIGIIAGHHAEILSGLGLTASTSADPAMADVLAKAKADIEAKAPWKAGSSAGKPAAAKPTPASVPKMPDIDRGAEWGSW